MQALNHALFISLPFLIWLQNLRMLAIRSASKHYIMGPGLFPVLVLVHLRTLHSDPPCWFLYFQITPFILNLF